MVAERFSRISGVGIYLPKRIVTNQDLVAMGVDTSNDWILERTGIETRRVASGEETNPFMAAEASKAALAMANQKVNRKAEHVLVATNSSIVNPDSRAGFPGVSSYVPERLAGLVEKLCGFADVQSGCPGINYALTYADGLIKARIYDRILVIGTEDLTGLMNLDNRETCVLFGDGASAYVLDVSDRPGFVAHRLHGTRVDRGAITSPLRLRRSIKDPAAWPVLSPTVQMDKGQPVYKFVKRVLVNTFIGFQEDKRLNPDGIKLSDIAKIVSHQANLRMFEAAAEEIEKKHGELGLSKEEIMRRFVITIQENGNSSAASQGPGMLEVLVGEHALPEGSHVLMIGYGAGLSWAVNHYIV